RRSQAACDRGDAWTDTRTGARPDGAAGRARAADAARRPRAGGAQICSACDVGTAARFIEPASRGLSGLARAISLAAVQGLALRAVLVPRVGRRRALCGRGGLSARGLTKRIANSE